MRLAQTQVWPALRNLLAITPWIALSRSASLKTMNGALPPSSRLTRFNVFAAFSISSFPTRVEPVKDSLRTVSLEVSASPIGSGGR